MIELLRFIITIIITYLVGKLVSKWKKIKKSGKAIIITTLTQSLGTFIIVSLVFGIVLKIVL